MKGPANADARILTRVAFAAKELVAGSQIWSVETEERAPVLLAVNIDVWSKEKETSNEKVMDNCGSGLNKGSKKDQRIRCHIFSFPYSLFINCLLFISFVFTFAVHRFYL